MQEIQTECQPLTLHTRGNTTCYKEITRQAGLVRAMHQTPSQLKLVYGIHHSICMQDSN